MNKSVAKQIKQFRLNSELSQEDVAFELGITKGAYSKIERAITAITVDRLAELSKIFKVDILSFLKSVKTTNQVAEEKPQYGFATKSDLEELINMINSLREEIGSMKKIKEEKKTAPRKKK